jgi:malonate transporter
MPVLERLLAMLVILLIGTGLRVTSILNDTRTARLNTITYYVALPALIFGATYQQSIVTLLSPKLVGGLVTILAATMVLAWLVHRNLDSKRRQSVALIQSYHSNLGYLGLPLVAATFNAKVTAIASVILGIISLIQVPLTILLLISINDSDV